MQEEKEAGIQRGRGRKGAGMGPGGFCVCPSCGEKVKHQRGMPCAETTCPKCGAHMVRK